MVASSPYSQLPSTSHLAITSRPGSPTLQWVQSCNEVAISMCQRRKTNSTQSFRFTNCHWYNFPFFAIHNIAESSEAKFTFDSGRNTPQFESAWGPPAWKIDNNDTFLIYSKCPLAPQPHGNAMIVDHPPSRSPSVQIISPPPTKRKGCTFKFSKSLKFDEVSDDEDAYLLAAFASHIEPPHKKKKTGIFPLQDEHHTIMDGTGKQRNTMESPTDDDKIGPSKPPPVSIGIRGGGFGETVSPALQAVPNGIQTIGLLLVQEDYGKFVKVDNHLWNKDVVLFVGEHSCTVNQQIVLNPVDHLSMTSNVEVNQHISNSLDFVDTQISSIRSKTQHFLTNLNILEDVHNILEDISHLQDSFSIGKHSQSLTESAINAGGEDRIDMNDVTKPEAGLST
ncbi:hypothetical protein IW261DRAFT_1423002 [Armillaria novae-zelandiae]|uniref:Uncharacterized protein n=1 Tax=Armillaria novae-zelandiae TaxID=153914 RepID=A0AA39NYU9_9AGAR|nr:hypothetical protein IW261DRAFT_1423002 [Armillaria novae-zelandiae]